MPTRTDLAERQPSYQTIFGSASSYRQEEREVGRVDRLVLRCGVDVFIIRSSEPRLVVAGETLEAIRSVRTTVRAGELCIDQVGGAAVFAGRGSFASIGNVVITGGSRVNINGVEFGMPRVAVGIALPRAPDIMVTGSGDVTMNGVDQDVLAITIHGSGDVSASGSVASFRASVMGSGDVDARSLASRSASLSVAGSGDIEAYVSHAVDAEVMGSGDITVHGNPGQRRKNVIGSGDVRFR